MTKYNPPLLLLRNLLSSELLCNSFDVVGQEDFNDLGDFGWE